MTCNASTNSEKVKMGTDMILDTPILCMQYSESMHALRFQRLGCMDVACYRMHGGSCSMSNPHVVIYPERIMVLAMPVQD